MADDEQMNVLTIHQEGRHRTPVRVTIDYDAETIRSTAADQQQLRRSYHPQGALHFINTFHDFKAVSISFILHFFILII